MRELMAHHPHAGRVDWIGLRAARRAPVEAVDRVEVTPDGLAGDHGKGRRAATSSCPASTLPPCAGAT
jgi:hypothetical protein